MRKLLLDKYNELLTMCDIDIQTEYKNMHFIIKNAIHKFVEKCECPAIWCYGNHTKALMADFIFEMRTVKFIIDNELKGKLNDKGFELIGEEQIPEKHIDGIIISSKMYRNDIVKRMQEQYSQVKYLDIYAELEKEGIYLDVSYYMVGNPYFKYASLNQLQIEIQDEKNKSIHISKIKRIIGIYIEMKDFKMAIYYIHRLIDLDDNSLWGKEVLIRCEELYYLQMDAINAIDQNNVLMLCVDGLRRRDINQKDMKKLYNFVQKRAYNCCNAYSLSIFTYESLIPAYSENHDLRTKYYETDSIKKEDCKFIQEARKQNRRIFFYTDGMKFIQDDNIVLSKQAQTASEKIWDFILDAVGEKNGLFYIHVLYESHFSYPNPYTRKKLYSEGTHFMFDYLDVNGGKLRADYKQQHDDAIRYLDDFLTPFISHLPCQMVLYADHGNVLPNLSQKQEDIEYTKYTFHEELIQVPLIIKSSEMKVGVDTTLRSLIDLNTIIIALMKREEINFLQRKFVKIARSELYNPNFRYVYEKVGNEHGLLAYEVFIFDNGFKLAIYSDGKVELYLSREDCLINKPEIEKELLSEIKDNITVCELGKIKA